MTSASISIMLMFIYNFSNETKRSLIFYSGSCGTREHIDVYNICE